MMSICKKCNRNKLISIGCLVSTLFFHNKAYTRIRVGDDGDFLEGCYNEKCPDCGAKYGHYHHYECDSERCPLCGHQLMTCECIYTAKEIHDEFSKTPSFDPTEPIQVRTDYHRKWVDAKIILVHLDVQDEHGDIRPTLSFDVEFIGTNGILVGRHLSDVFGWSSGDWRYKKNDSKEGGECDDTVSFEIKQFL